MFIFDIFHNPVALFKNKYQLHTEPICVFSAVLNIERVTDLNCTLSFLCKILSLLYNPKYISIPILNFYVGFLCRTYLCILPNLTIRFLTGPSRSLVPCPVFSKESVAVGTWKVNSEDQRSNQIKPKIFILPI